MKLEDIQNFVETINSIKEGVVYIDNSNLCVNSGDNIFSIEYDKIDSISMFRRKIIGTEVIVNTFNEELNQPTPALYFTVFENKMQTISYVAYSLMYYLYSVAKKPLLFSAIGFLLGFFTFSGIKFI